MATVRLTKNQLRRAKKKEQKQAQKEAKTQDATPEAKPESTSESTPDEKPDEPTATTTATTDDTIAKGDPKPSDPTGDIDIDVVDDDADLSQFRSVFERFGVSLDAPADDTPSFGKSKHQQANKGEIFYNQDDDIPDDDEDRPKLSKKKRKMLNQVSVAELKTMVPVPEVVEWQDVNSAHPKLLVRIKAQRNVVPVPGHWTLKREYLSSKRGLEKPAFQLPKFIAETGITEMRDAVLEKQDPQTLKQKQRERVQPKMGRLDIDYQKLYDAFFRFQEKPSLTRFGEVYYEGKELDVDYSHYRPGELSEAAREALGMPSASAPPPWLFNQQRFGPPPSYPTLLVPGVNAPIPPGASWGFMPGGWGQPPVDELNQPRFGGDLFGLAAQAGYGPSALLPVLVDPVPVDRTIWGELQPPDEESEEEESDEDEDEDEDEEEEADGEGVRKKRGEDDQPIADVDIGGTEYGVDGGAVEGEFDLRKTRRGTDTEVRSAYTILPEKQASLQGFMGSEHVYDLQAAGVLDDDGRKRKQPGSVDVSVDLDQVGASHSGQNADWQRQYYEQIQGQQQQQQAGAQWKKTTEDDADLDELIAQESRKRQRVDEQKDRKSKYRF